MYKDHKDIGIGAIDCDNERNKCGQYGVNGFPTIKAIVAGKGRSYNGAREAANMKAFVQKIADGRGSKGGSAKCRAGIFKNKLKHAVVPLCETHFPDQKAKNDWLILFYDHNATAEMRDNLNTVAIDLGNDPPDMNKVLKKQQKKRERIEKLAGQHDIKTNLPAKGPFGMDELAKVGGVCCDCDEEHSAFCATYLKQGEEDFKPPQVFWISKGKSQMIKDIDFSPKALTTGVFGKIGVSSESSGKEEL